MLKKKDEKSNNIESAIIYAKKYLPQQGPLEYFVHHNTLHAFEEYHFFSALGHAKNLYNAKTHKSFYWFQSRFKEGRITQEDLERSIELNVLDNLIDKKILIELLFWNGQETSRVTTIQKEKHLSILNLPAEEGPNTFTGIETFWENIKTNIAKERLERSIDSIRIKFFAAFFDKGLAYWKMEGREEGIFSCFSNYCNHLPAVGFSKFLKNELGLHQANQGEVELDKLSSILQRMKIPTQFWKSFIFKVLYKIKGWSGLVLALEETPQVNPTKINISFNEYLLVNLLIECAAYNFLVNKSLIKDFEFKYEQDITHEKSALIASYVYELLENNSMNEGELKQKLISLDEAKFFDKVNHSLLLKIWQEAYEWKITQNTFSVLCNKEKEIDSNLRSNLQVVTCIDDREESIRRYFEEEDNVQTFGYAGHFGLNMFFKGAEDIFFKQLCPVGSTPNKHVWECQYDQAIQQSNSFGKIKHFFFHHSKMPLIGAFSSIILGPLSIINFFIDIFFPRMRLFNKNEVQTNAKTTLDYEAIAGREHSGYDLTEMSEIVYQMLKTIGLTKNFAPIIYICGHGSSSLNNPHNAAYNCGACAGGVGAANARLFALMANRKDVQKELEEKNVFIPKDVRFVGGYHNTCNDDFLIFDTEQIDIKIVDKIRRITKKVARQDARERVRKFQDTSLLSNEEDAICNVQLRSRSYSKLRPEYGHATNSTCIVGNRAISKNIFFDRRAFLVSYDATSDPSGKDLASLLASIVPVCAGINLEYYFSYVDREVFGAGVKQPHNVTSLMGVMNGYSSDLRLGLPWQMVEIHEPLRILIVIESSEVNFIKALESSGPAKNLVKNEWVRIALITPSGGVKYYNNLEFVDFTEQSKKRNEKPEKLASYIKGKRETLAFKEII